MGALGGLGMEFTATQDEGTITITRTTQLGETKSTYKLDGSESRNALTLGNTSIDQLSRAKWDGNKLVITTNIDLGRGGAPIESKMTLSLDASGNLLVESTTPGFGRAGGDTAPTTRTTTYKKG
jgi:hypothetical protein